MPFLPSSIPDGLVFVHKRSSAERDAICAGLAWASLKAIVLGSISELLGQLDGSLPACLITDLPTTLVNSPMPLAGISREEWDSPVEPGKGHADSHTLVMCAACLTESGCAFREESFCFLRRPYTRGQLLTAVVQAIVCDRGHQERCKNQAQMRLRIDSLTPREHQVMDLIYEGWPNKSIAGQLNVSTRTVEAARSMVYRKLNVDSGLALVRLLGRMEYEVASQNN